MKIWKLFVDFAISIRIDINRNAQSNAQALHTATCNECGWSRDYETAKQAKRGLAAHFVHCSGEKNNDGELSDLWDRMNGH